MKVTKLHIDEYKVFKDFDIDFTNEKGEAQNLIVLAGINGTGKTTLLEFLFITIAKRGSYMNGAIEGNSFIEIAHKPQKNLFLPQNSFSENGTLTKLLFDSRKYDGVNLFFNISKYDIQFFRVKKYDFEKVNTQEDEQAYSDDPSPEIRIIKNYIDKYIYDINPILSSEVYAKLSDFINSIFSDFSLGFRFKRYGSEYQIYFETLQDLEIALEDLSTGERQILNFALRLFVAGIKHSIILIDEPEFSLHPTWQNKIVGVLQKYADEYNCQVILATHSPHIIGSVKPEALRLLYKDESGAIKVVEHTPNAYGLSFDRVLTEVMGVENLRTPDVDRLLKELSDLIKRNAYESVDFLSKMKAMEDLIGYSDGDLILMRFEIAKRKKLSAANK